jgi:hypothetical protein
MLAQVNILGSTRVRDVSLFALEMFASGGHEPDYRVLYPD